MKSRVEIEERISRLEKAKDVADDRLDEFPDGIRYWVKCARINSEIESLKWVLDES